MAKGITQKSVWPPIKFSEDIILQKLNKPNTSKSAGPDELHPKILDEVNKMLSYRRETALRVRYNFRQK